MHWQVLNSILYWNICISKCNAKYLFNAPDDYIITLPNFCFGFYLFIEEAQDLDCDIVCLSVDAIKELSASKF